MENDSNGSLLENETQDHIKNGIVPSIMAKFPEGNFAALNKETNILLEIPKVNGESSKDTENDSHSSESDALIIDENFPKKQRKTKKKSKSQISAENTNCNKNIEIVTHSNPFFNESLFELSQQHQTSQPEGQVNSKYKKGKNKPQVKNEYAQYLGLQPAIQFKCSKCGRAGFETLAALQEHVGECNEETVQEIASENSCSGFKLTRKVFLCSACGTYYENWNLYMHMLEIHQRYICLYCLGMFSVLEDLCQHLQSKHNLQPGYKNTPDDFFSSYNEPCYLICCECNKVFSEQDNFFYHNCTKSVSKLKKTKTHITPENHVTGETETIDEMSSKLDKEIEEINKAYEENNSITLDTQENITMETTNENIMSNKSEQNSDKMEIEEEQDNISLKSIDNEEDVIEGSDRASDTMEENVDNECDINNKLQNSMNHESVQNSDQEEVENEEVSPVRSPIETEEHLETRKVPKLSLKLPKPGFYVGNDSDDSEKLMVDHVESDNDDDHDNLHDINKEEMDLNISDIENQDPEEEDKQYDENEDITGDGDKELSEECEEQLENENEKTKRGSIQIAGPEVQIIELVLEQPLDKFDPCILLQKCLKNTIQGCIYCNHARKIAVNGKQLALHCIAEHRFSAVVNSITAEELIPESFVNCLTESLDDLEKKFFSLESSFTHEAVTFSHLFECFQCYFSTTVHKELYLHNRKFHSKNLLLCIMCKSNFYSYSELICHLCPGVYVLDYDLHFRCCMCVNDDLLAPTKSKSK